MIPDARAAPKLAGYNRIWIRFLKPKTRSDTRSPCVSEKKRGLQKPSSKENKKQPPARQNEPMQEAAPGYLPPAMTGREMPDHRTADRYRRRAVQRMQRTAGNQRVLYYLQNTESGKLVQRTQIRDPATREVIHNQTDPTTNRFQAGGSGGSYSVSSFNISGGSAGSVNYQMTRSSGGVTVNVRIKFVAEFGAEPSTNIFGQAAQAVSGERVAAPVPAGQQQSARDICTALVTHWNNKFQLVGRPTPASPAPAAGAAPASPAAPAPAAAFGASAPVTAPAATGGAGPAPSADEIVLPVNFVATPVFDLNADADSTVRFDATTAAGGANIINATNWYANVGTYPGGVSDTYAHEYGHLLGIPDEYSLSNANAHALMHQISPSQGTNLGRDLDQAGKREMIMSAIRPHLQSRIGALGGEVARSLQAQQDGMSRALATAVRSAWREAGIIDTAAARVRTQLEGAGQNEVARAVNRAFRFEALQNLSNITLAKAAVPGELSPVAIQRLITNAFRAAADRMQMTTVDLTVPGQSGGSNQMTMEVSLAPAVQGASSPLNAAAATAAQEAVGTPAAAGAPGAAPPVYPSNTLIGGLTSLASGWDNVGTQMESSLNNLSTEITNAVNAALATDISGEVAGSTRNLYTVLYNLVNNVSQTAMQAVLRQFLDSQITPVINSQMANLINLIETEPSRHTRATGTGTNAAPDTPPSPALLTAATSMRTQAQQLLRPPDPAGGGQAQQNVTYTAHTLMGANAAGQSLRTQQMQTIQENFNNQVPQLRHDGEDRFTVRSTGS